MSNSIDIQPIKQKLDQAQTVLVLFGSVPTVDHVASGLALYLALKELKKDVIIASPAQMRAEFSRLIGLDEVGNSISNRDLVIGFNNFDFADIEKVSHNDGSGSRFELIIQPKAGKKAPQKNNVDFGYRGADADMIFLVGVKKLEELENLYEAERSLFTKSTVVSFNRRQAAEYASMALFDKEASSLSEIVMQFMEKIEMKVKDDIASNLLSGIDFATNRFQNPMISPEAFMMAGKLLQNGARRQPPRMSPSPSMGGNGGFMPFVPPSAQNRLPQTNNGGIPNSGKQLAQGNGNKNNKSNPPQDWLKPKIYKGGSGQSKG